MECLYSEYLDSNSKEVTLSEDELYHLKAFRLRKGNKILITNGKGLTAECEYQYIGKTRKFKVLNLFENFGENSYKISLAFSTLKHTDRLEFAIEKSVEFGVNTLYPVYFEHTQKKKFSYLRAYKKVLAAMKQCKRSVFTEIKDIQSFEEFVNNDFTKFSKIIVCDESGDKLTSLDDNIDNMLVIVGPEGGFSQKEYELIKSYENVSFINLSKRRLRTETAIVNILSLINYLK